MGTKEAREFVKEFAKLNFMHIQALRAVDTEEAAQDFLGKLKV